MINVFDITDFGAVGDGKTDCTAAIQTALDRAGEVHGCVTVPPGTYLTGELKMRTNTRLEGMAGWSFGVDGLSIFKLNDPNAKYMIDITGAFGVTIAGISMDGGCLGNNIHGIHLHWDRYNGGGREDTPTIEDCRIGRFTGNGVHLEHIWCFSVRHSMINNNYGAGLYVDGWDGFIIDNWLTANKQGGMIGPCIASVTATGNRVEWNTVVGLKLTFGNSVNVTGNYFDRTFGPAIWIGETDGKKFENTTVTGNVFYRGGCPDRCQFGSEYESSHVYIANGLNVTVTGNVYKVGVNDDGSGTRSPQYGIVVNNSDAIIVQSNTMRLGYMNKGIVWDEKGDCIVKDNIE